MSIWIQQLMTVPLESGPIVTTMPAATSATTQAASDTPIAVFIAAAAQAAVLLAAGVSLLAATYGVRRLEWSPARVPEPRAALPLWTVVAAMVWCFLAVPSSVALALRGPTTMPVSDATQALAYTLTCVVGLGVAGAMHFALRRGRTPEMIGLLPLRATLLPGRAFVAAMIALPLTYLVSTFSMLVMQRLGITHDPAHAMLLLMKRNESTPWVLWLMIANATVLAPVFEEVLFRGHVQTALGAALPRSRWPAILITSLLFASIHDAWTAVPIFALSVAIGAAYEWTGSLWVAVAIHVAFNGVSTAVFLATH